VSSPAGDPTGKDEAAAVASAEPDRPHRRPTRSLPREPGAAWALLEAVRELSGELELDVLLSRAMDVSTSLVKADRSSLFLYDRPKDELWSKIAQGLDTLVLRFPASKGLAGHAARTGEIVRVPDAYEDPRFNREFDEKTGYRTRAVLCVPMTESRGHHVLGVIQVLNKQGGDSARPEDRRAGFSSADEELLLALGSYLAPLIETAQLHESIERLFDSFARASTTAIDERDPATAGHTKRVAKYAVHLARAAHQAGLAEFTRARLKQLGYAALLHDFGKIGVRESVLTKRNKLSDDRLLLVEERMRRSAMERGDSSWLDEALELVRRANVPGRITDEDVKAIEALAREGLLTPSEVENLSVRRGNLTEAEWKDMKSHADGTLDILSKIPWPEELSRVPEIAHRHHEKLDGSGYPKGLKEQEIDLDARILEVADIYDALTAQDRPYKPAIPHDRARAIMKEEVAAGKLDGRLVELFFEKDVHRIDLSQETVVFERAG
jgi:HD-GYP domain-containing protein (c-di-GMP phosphodiesterase class II)